MRLYSKIRSNALTTHARIERFRAKDVSLWMERSKAKKSSFFSYPHCSLYAVSSDSSRRFFVSSTACGQQESPQTTSIIFKPWKKPMIESHGDYRVEAAELDEHIGGPLYEHQKSLPKLPVPALQETIDRFLPTALPLARSKDEETNLIQACNQFVEQAKILQDRLVDRQMKDMKDSSWLQLWWNQMGYLQVRDPVVVNVSYFFYFVDDPTITYSGVTTVAGETVPVSSLTPTKTPNVQRGAALLFAAAEFRKRVCSGQLPADTVGRKGNPLCSAAYKYMFNACRIPRAEQDTYRIYDPSKYTHCIVARSGHFFSVELVDPTSGDPLPVSALEDQLEQCIQLADAAESDGLPKLGVLTSGNRDDWASDREALVQLGGEAMEKALERLESGAILLNLDDETPVSRKECGELFWTGGVRSGNNRWFDKSIQIAVANNGKAGLIAEHSMMDGMPVVNFGDYISSMTYSDAKERSSSSAVTSDSISSVKNVFADALAIVEDRQAVKGLETKAFHAFTKLVNGQDNHIQSFQGYGSTFMKQSGFSPDAFVQIAMQLAAYRLYGEPVGTYEATQVRPFLHGRTETTRTVSPTSKAFVEMMGLRPKKDNPLTAMEKVNLLNEATTSHSEYMKNAANGQGVDRHFLGLSLLVKENEMAPALFSDPVYIRSKRWRLSTSNLTHPNFALWGFGEVFPDGVGLAYAVLPTSCMFHVTALRETGWTDKLSELLEEALLEMRDVVEIAAGTAQTPPPQ